jgi:hypothetical protein
MNTPAGSNRELPVRPRRLRRNATVRALFEVFYTMSGPRRFGRIRIEYLPPAP